MERDHQNRKKEIVADIKRSANLSDRQLEILDLRFGLSGAQQPLDGAETALKLGITQQRVGQLLRKCIEKLKAASDSLGYNLDSIHS